MKRQSLALLIHPFGNRLVSRASLKESVVGCMRSIAELAEKYPTMRLNVVLPGYALECLDGLLLSELREHGKRGAIEWLVTGYTEPFVSLSPPWLTKANIKLSIEMAAELLDSKPSGYVPPFSNWEPFIVELLKDLGIHYVVLSTAVFPAAARQRCGYWATENLGSSILLFPLHVLHHYNAPAQLGSWLENVFGQDCDGGDGAGVVGVQYLLPLSEPAGIDPLQWLRAAVKGLSRNPMRYQTVRFGDFLSDAPPLGLQYLQPSLDLHGEGEEPGRFRNWLFSHGQVGILHRRMMEVCDSLAPHAGKRAYEKQMRDLFSVQDTNRFLPAPESGFAHLADRLWSYNKLIEIEQRLPEAERARGGQIRIADHLRNGSKCIVMTNRALKAYINHRCGGALFELDFGGRGFNLVAGYDRRRFAAPAVVEAGRSKMAFVDHLLPVGTSLADFEKGEYTELGDLVGGSFDYRVHTAQSGVRAVLARQAVAQQGGRNCPLTVEKVFGLERGRGELSFAYQLSNPTLTPYTFTFATELTFAFPGVAGAQARLRVGRTTVTDLGTHRATLAAATQLAFEDRRAGVRVVIRTQKPVDVWCYPLARSDDGPYQGTTVVLTSTVALAGNGMWSLMGKLVCRSIRKA
jgi:hypothetical protein